VVNYERTFKGVAFGVTPWRLFADANEIMQARGVPARIAKPGVLLRSFDLERVQARGSSVGVSGQD
jgi:hypothetical protein